MEASIAEDIASICSSVKPSEEKEVLAIDRSSDSATPFTFISDSKPISKCSFLSYWCNSLYIQYMEEDGKKQETNVDYLLKGMAGVPGDVECLSKEE